LRVGIEEKSCHSGRISMAAGPLDNDGNSFDCHDAPWCHSLGIFPRLSTGYMRVSVSQSREDAKGMTLLD